MKYLQNSCEYKKIFLKIVMFSFDKEETNTVEAARSAPQPMRALFRNIFSARPIVLKVRLY